MIRELRSFWQDENGTEIVEWILVTAILLAAGVPVLIYIGEALKAAFEKILEELGGRPPVTPTP